MGSTFAFFLPPRFPPDIFLLRAGGIAASSGAIAAPPSDSDDSAAGGSVLPSKLARIFLSTLATASCFADSPPAGVGSAWPEADCGAAGVGQRITASGEPAQTRRSYRGTGEHASSQELGGNGVSLNACSDTGGLVVACQMLKIAFWLTSQAMPPPSSRLRIRHEWRAPEKKSSKK